VQADGEPILEEARSISNGLWHMVGLAHNAAETLESRVEYEDLDGLAEVVEVREVLERLQTLGHVRPFVPVQKPAVRSCGAPLTLQSLASSLAGL
jgi:hypothetical protein